jgi:hypothetical protein
MNEWMTFKQVQDELGISRPTLLKHINRANMQIHFDPHDHRVKLLTPDQVSRLREIVERIRNRNA